MSEAILKLLGRAMRVDLARRRFSVCERGGGKAGVVRTIRYV